MVLIRHITWLCTDEFMHNLSKLDLSRLLQGVSIPLFSPWSCSAGPRLNSDDFVVGIYENWTQNRAYLNGSVRTYPCFSPWSYSCRPKLLPKLRTDDCWHETTEIWLKIKHVSTLQYVRIQIFPPYSCLLFAFYLWYLICFLLLLELFCYSCAVDRACRLCSLGCVYVYASDLTGCFASWT